MLTSADDGLDADVLPELSERPLPTAGTHAYSSQQREAMMAGLSLSVLCEIFGKDKREAKARLKEVQPMGMRAGFPVYDLKEAARYLVDPVVDVEEFIKKLRPQDLPMALQAEFWKGQNQRLKFEEETGELWRTSQVQTVLADTFRVVRQTVSLFSEAVERQVGLTEEQRKLLTNMCDGLLEDTGKAIVSQFKNYDPSKDHIDVAFDTPGIVVSHEVDDGL
jgi:hypothetical protein